MTIRKVTRCLPLTLACATAALLALALPQLPAAGLLQRVFQLAKPWTKSRLEEAAGSQPRKTNAPIVGSFGVKLGQVMKQTRIAWEEDGYLACQFTPAQPHPTFRTYFVYLLPMTHRIGAIQAESGETDPEVARAMLDLVSERYGAPASQKVDGAVKTWGWSDGRKRLDLTWNPPRLIISYGDHLYDIEARKEMVRWKAKPPSRELRGGPPALAGLTLEKAFGMRLGDVATPTETMKLTGEGPSIDFEGKEVLPGMTRFYVLTTTTDLRVHRITAVGRLTTPEHDQLRADLVAKFGPSSVPGPSSLGGRYSAWVEKLADGNCHFLMLYLDNVGATHLTLQDLALSDRAKAELDAPPSEVPPPESAPNYAVYKLMRRDRATTIKNDLRLIDAAKDQWAQEKGKSGNVVPAWSDLTPYFKTGSRLANLPGPTDVLGNPFQINSLERPPQVSARTAEAFRDVIELSFWSPFAP